MTQYAWYSLSVWNLGVSRFVVPAKRYSDQDGGYGGCCGLALRRLRTLYRALTVSSDFALLPLYYYRISAAFPSWDDPLGRAQ